MNEAKSLTKDIINNSKLITSDAESLLKHFGKEPDVTVKPTPRASRSKKTRSRKITYEEPKKEQPKNESKKEEKEEKKVDLNPNKRLIDLTLDEFYKLYPEYKGLKFSGPQWWFEEIINRFPDYGWDINKYGMYTIQDLLDVTKNGPEAQHRRRKRNQLNSNLTRS